MRETARSILIVDDHEDTLKLYSQVLLRNGYEVAIARDGEEALEWIDKYPPNLVVLDIMMPSLNGWEVCRRIKNTPALSSVIVLIVSSGIRRDGALQQLASECGAVEVVPKPLSPPELLTKIKTYLKNPPSRSAA
ncbi:MAG: response regulator [Nitrospirae bacterium]|nr:response regulator [Candidatus Manganitrophaceae bacterium]